LDGAGNQVVILHLDESLKKYFRAEDNLFYQLMSLRGECFRHHKNRATYKISLGGDAYFIKQHQGVGWREIFKNLIQGRAPIVSAKNEWLALQKLQTLGIPAPIVVGYGECGFNPATKKSFILTKALPESVSLETLCADWKNQPPGFKLKQSLIKKIAHIAKTLHDNGINHRDFYLCHFLLADETLYLIDLHRAQIRKNVPDRWLVKDLAGLYFSSINLGFTKHDYLRFIKYYRAASLRDIVKKEKAFWEIIKKRGECLYRDHNNG
jgi:tRNA A-37 threonylcarbamoyl transferase component Bud32